MITVEVKNQQEENPKDIFFKGNIVVSKTTGNIVLVTSPNSSDCFKGVSLFTVENYFIGDICNEFYKKNFTQFTGTITITSK